jgi:hypothetical protein
MKWRRAQKEEWKGVTETVKITKLVAVKII